MDAVFQFDPLVGGFLMAAVASVLLGAVMRWLSASIGAVVPPRPGQQFRGKALGERQLVEDPDVLLR